MQAMVMRNRWLTNQMMSRMSAQTHLRQGEKTALRAADAALKRTRAYPDYLESTGRTVAAVTSMKDFASLPVTDKKSYIDRYRLRDLCLDGEFTAAYTIERSSGHSGGSYYWLRLPEEDALFPQYLEHAFVQFYGMDKKSTLVLITLALGTWTSGEKMAQALRQVAATGKHPLTVMAPGTDIEDILEIVSDLAHSYDQLVIVGYPPFIKTVIDEGSRRGIDWTSFGVKLGLGGEGYSEQWREHMASLVGVDAKRDLLAVSGGYGAADIGMTIGREYPVTVLIRKLCVEDPDLASSLFHDHRGNHASLPSLLQYSPSNCYVEEVDGELVFTVLSGIPVVRYNIHDSGGVATFDATMETLRKHGYDVLARLRSLGYGREQVWQLPFFYVYGRSDGTVSIVGANVFPENVEAILSEARDRDIRTFKLSVETTSDFSQRLSIALEHRAESLSGSEASELGVRYHGLLVRGLRRINQDFRDAHDDNPQSADPVVEVHARGTGPFAGAKGIKDHYIL